VKEKERELLLGAMLRQEELAFIKALGRMKPSPAFLRELRKAKALSKTTKKVPSMKTKKPLTTSRAAVEATTAKLKRKAAELPVPRTSQPPLSSRPTT
jgi:hypothetical protein